jgi:putative transposase
VTPAFISRSVTVTKRLRAGYPGPVYHVTNHAIKGQLLFQDFGEHLTFLRTLAWALGESPVVLFAFCLMPNHIHLLVQPAKDEDLSTFMYDLTKTYALAVRRWRGDVGAGAVFKGPFRRTLVDTETYFYTAARYIARNPVRAGLVERPKDYLWSSASRICAIQGVRLAPWPVPRPDGWDDFVNQPEPPRELDFVRKCVRHGKPLTRPSLDLEPPTDLARTAIVRVGAIAIPDKE